MKKVTLGVLVIGSLLNLFGESKNPQQIETLTEKQFGIKEIENCENVSEKSIMGETLVDTKQIFVSSKNSVVDFKDGYEKKYIVCKENNMILLKINTKVFKTKEDN
jgi:hypothetical protein